MKKLESILSADDFVMELEAWRRLWRRRAHGKSDAMRHAKNVLRKHIRLFKRKRNIASLPKLQVVQGAETPWQAASPDNVKLVFPYRIEGGSTASDLRPTDAATLRREGSQLEYSSLAFRSPNSLRDGDGSSETPARMRKRLKRILHASIERRSDRHIDLINAGSAPYKKLPSLADASFGRARASRGLYLEAVGGAFLPNLSAADVAALEAQGATVLDNEIIAVVDPLDKAEPVAGPDTKLWHLDKIDIHAARNKKLRGKGVLIGILDTGIDPDHPEFAGKAIHYRAFDAAGVPILEPAKDYDRHGTHVAAICAGKSVGVAPDASLAVAAVMTGRNEHGQMCGFLYQIIIGLNWLANHAGPDGRGVDIINASLGGPVSEAPHYYQVIFGHRTGGKMMVAAIGNDGESGMGTRSAPGRFQCVLAVGASDEGDHVTTFSSWGSAYEGDRPVAEFKPDLVAPGVNIYSALPRARYGRRSGTSMACPIVTGAAALLLEQDATLRVDANELTRKLLTLTKDLPEQLHNPDKRCYGRGRLHLAAI